MVLNETGEEEKRVRFYGLCVCLKGRCRGGEKLLMDSPNAEIPTYFRREERERKKNHKLTHFFHQAKNVRHRIQEDKSEQLKKFIFFSMLEI